MIQFVEWRTQQGHSGWHAGPIGWTGFTFACENNVIGGSGDTVYFNVYDRDGTPPSTDFCAFGR
jgi:hypothetical protein